MEITEIIYSNSDPTLDMYYSNHYRELVFGARRYISNKSVTLDCLTHRVSAWPPDEGLGELLIKELLSPELSVPYDFDNSWCISSAKSKAEFQALFWPLNLWTKPDPSIPIILGAPLSNHYPDSFNRRPIAKPVTHSNLAAAVRTYVDEITLYLKRAGLSGWL
jgi:hypothetical protein